MQLFLVFAYFSKFFSIMNDILFFKNNSFWRNTLLFNLVFVILLFVLSGEKRKCKFHWGKIISTLTWTKNRQKVWKFSRQKYYRDWVLRLWIRWSEFLHEHKSLKHSSNTWIQSVIAFNMCIWFFKADWLYFI